MRFYDMVSISTLHKAKLHKVQFLVNFFRISTKKMHNQQLGENSFLAGEYNLTLSFHMK